MAGYPKTFCTTSLPLGIDPQEGLCSAVGTSSETSRRVPLRQQALKHWQRTAVVGDTTKSAIKTAEQKRGEQWEEKRTRRHQRAETEAATSDDNVFTCSNCNRVVKWHLEDNNINSLSSFSKSAFPPTLEVLHESQEVVHKPFEKITSLRKFHLDFNNFHYVPLSVQGKSHLPRVQTLLLNSNKITFIVEGTFSELDTLNYLEISNNQIVAIENGAFPVTIKTLNLQNNRFNFKHENQFTNLSQLSSLNLVSNRIDVVPITSFHGLSSLTSLSLNSNKICRILKFMFKDLTSLQTLDLSHNDIAFIEDGALANLPALSSMNLYNNQLTTLPVDGDFHNRRINYL
ncbi:PREDICTED: leucine-rich repeat-containing G-protein coupled receptor 4-like [Acropora digitifera]|uniref:leucine-rich repeat-containing G-protein coupled receptor 4-like n=1 Tax=Acropora digitifera TaxID=70779 RepID=UPI00077A4D5F|nr:PREDICTED: leucine-rich repeat-containing G-protein coupled receptor 4-like [Acropora digitifera]